VRASSTARNWSFASAAKLGLSWADDTLNYDPFAWGWIAAQLGHEASGAPLAHNPDLNIDGAIEASEAFEYAKFAKYRDDSPMFDGSLPGGGNITLVQAYALWPLWCEMIGPIIEKYYPPFPPGPGPGPDPAFQAQVRALT